MYVVETYLPRNLLIPLPRHRTLLRFTIPLSCSRSVLSWSLPLNIKSLFSSLNLTLNWVVCFLGGPFETLE